MNYFKHIYKNGMIPLEPNYNKSKYVRKQRKTSENVDVCLNCTKTKCNGNCKKAREAK